MKKHLILLVIFVLGAFSIEAQTVRGLRIGYIDMEYILQNVPDYTEAKNQLEQKAQLWKQEIDKKNNEITQLKESLKTERVLLTKELIEEREEEIAYQESELAAFQEKRFGPTGDLMIQKAVLVKPIQDQIFTAVQDIADQRRYDFIFDKSSDLTVLYAAKQHDISESVIRQLTRSSKRSQLTNKELKEEAKKEYKEDVEDQNSDFAVRKKMLDDRKAARDKLIADKKAANEKIVADRKAAAEQKKAEAAAKRQEQLDNRTGIRDSITGQKTGTKTDTASTNKVIADKIALRKEIADKKAKDLADRKQAIADKKAKMAADRAAKQAKEQKTPVSDTIRKEEQEEQ